MTFLQSILVAMVQGLTEFLPVSSSGHMVLVESALGINTEGVLWEVALHVGTLLAVFAVFWRELWQAVAGLGSGLAQCFGKRPITAIWEREPGFRMGCYILIATIPAAVIGITVGDIIKSLFSKPILSAVLIFVTGEILWLSRPHSLMHPAGKLKLADSIAIGLAQAAALLPGISRSGITISAGLTQGIGREQAVRFSFLLSVPAILGAAVLESRKLSGLPAEQIAPMISGVAVAAVSGYIALRFLLRVVKAGKLHLFSYYCWAISIIGVTLLWSEVFPASHH